MNSREKITQANTQPINSQSIVVFVTDSVHQQVIKISEITLAFQKVKRQLVSRNELLQVQVFVVLDVFERAQNIVHEYLSLIDMMREDYLLYASLQKPILLQLHNVIYLTEVNKQRIQHFSNEHSSSLKASCTVMQEMIKDINQINESFEEISNLSKNWLDSIGGMIKP